jgi:hypothetical protein
MPSVITLVLSPIFVKLLPKLSDLRQKCFENEIQIFHFFFRTLVRNVIHSNKFSVSRNLEAHRNECMFAYSIGFLLFYFHQNWNRLTNINNTLIPNMKCHKNQFNFAPGITARRQRA